MPLQVVETQRLYQQVAEQLGNLIDRGEFREGERLPAERELSKKLGVSRPVVREAMIALEIAGLVEVRGGAGAFVKNARIGANRALAALPDPGPSPFDLITARKLLEGEIAFMAASAVHPQDIRELEQSIAQMRQDIDAGRDSRPADRVFHVRLAEATRNAVLAHLVDSMWAHMLAPIFDALGKHTNLSSNDPMTVDDHARIVAALARRDGEAARLAMQEHLSHVEKRLMKTDLE
ncbi:MAG TPA: FadR/GntR family transcriptional regulator [Dongiaceae bacterium]|jgi:DNA-binding FadR family transcriptional regulator|nr:FadR/GntR family transcriptional regulator [Dongiaceae bacterium]